MEDFVADLTTPEERRDMERHLAECDDCRAAYHRTRGIEEALIAAREVPDAIVESGLARLALVEGRPAESKGRRSIMPLIAAASLMTGIFGWLLSPQVEDKPVQQSGPSFEEKRLVMLPEGASELRVSPDGRAFAFVVTSAGKSRIVAGDWTSEPYDTIDSLSYTRAGVLMFQASNAIGFGKQVLSPAPRAYVISEDGSQIAWTVERGGVWFVAFAGREEGPYDEIGEIVLSRDGKRLAFAARTGAQWSAVVDGRAGRKYGGVDGLAWSPSGETAYRASTGNKCVVVVGVRASDEFDEVGAPVFHPNGKQVAYRARVGKGWFIVEGEKRGDEFDQIETPHYTPDGRLVVISDGYLDFDGRGPFQAKNVRECRSGADGSIALVARDRVSVLHPGEKQPRASNAYAEVNGVHFARVAGGREVIVYRGVDRAWSYAVIDIVEGPRFREMGNPVISPDGRFVAYPALRSGKWVLVTGAIGHDEKGRIKTDTRRSDDFDEVGPPVFSADGKKVAFSARKGREVFWKVIATE